MASLALTLILISAAVCGLAKLKEAADKVETSLDNYNQTLSLADRQGNVLDADEAALNDLNSRILSGVGARHGTNSSQYEQAGGTRKDERKAPVRKKKTA